MRAQTKRIILYIVIAAVIVIFGAVAILFAPKSSPASAQEHIDLGHTYLIELSYDKAVIEFTEAIEIEPLNADAYLGLAEAYVGIEDNEKAVEVLEEGYDKTADERLKAMLEKLLSDEIIVTTVSDFTASLENEPISEIIEGNDYLPQINWDQNASFTIDIINNKEANINIFSDLINDEYVIYKCPSEYDYSMIMGCVLHVDKWEFGIYVWGYNLQGFNKLTWNDVGEFACIYVRVDEGYYDYAFKESDNNYYIKATPNTDLHTLSLSIKLPENCDLNFNNYDYDYAFVNVYSLKQQ